MVVVIGPARTHHHRDSLRISLAMYHAVIMAVGTPPGLKV